MGKVEALESVPGTGRLTSSPHQCFPSVEAEAALCFLLFLHSAVPVLDWLSWQPACRRLGTLVSRPKGAVLFPGKSLGCEDEATKAEFIPSPTTIGVSAVS